MDLFQAVILGMIQGLTEFLPISSTGHLYLGRHLFGLDEAGLFLDTMLHLGTLIAVSVVYHHELIGLIKHPFRRLTLLLIVGTIPAVILGLLFNDFFEAVSKTGATIGWEFLITGVALWGADQVKNSGHKQMEQITFADVLIIGTFQGAAIMPALSRSGLTIAAALFRGIDKATAAYFSFLLSIPAIAGGLLLQSLKVYRGELENISASSLITATAMSAIFGFIAVKWMISTLKQGSLKGFAYYVWAIGSIILIAQFTGFF